MNKISLSNILSMFSKIFPEKFIQIIKSFGNTTCHIILGVFLLGIIIFLGYIFKNKIVSMHWFIYNYDFLYIDLSLYVSFNSQKKLNKYKNLLDKLCSKNNNNNSPECIEYVKN